MAKPVKCPRCGRDNDASFAFCLDCGQAMRPAPAAGSAPARHCVGCGAPLQPGFKFCAHCGRAAAPTGVASTPAGPPIAPRFQAPPVPATPPGLDLQVTVDAAVPRLSAVRHDGLPGLVLELRREETLCGRTEGELRLGDDPTVSPRHARFTRKGSAVRVEDLGSVNGTYLRLRGPHRITIGEELRIGRQLVRLEPLPRPAGGEEREGRPWGSPDAGATLRLAQLLDGGGVAEIFPLRPGENSVGRDVGDVSFPGDRYVSARHATIQVDPGGVTITDLNSSNGTFRKVLGSVDLASGDQLLLGSQLFKLEA
jgi:pSer/pThr/pTyr-binding forkhead associated (FHA) protein